MFKNQYKAIGVIDEETIKSNNPNGGKALFFYDEGLDGIANGAHQ